MSCYHPLKAFKVGFNRNTGKSKIMVTSYQVSYVSKFLRTGKIYKMYDDPDMICAPNHRDISRIRSPNWRDYTDYDLIPCGKCVGCRLEYSRQWANRCMLELKDHASSYFVTLTYDNDHLPLKEIESDGVCLGQVATLDKRDFQLFMKRLRKAYSKCHDNLIRFYACGEYGSTTQRPHYHVILFGLELDDLKFYKRSDLGMPLYNSEWLSRIWGKGHVVIGNVTWESCAYTARYVLKKVNGQLLEERYTKLGIVPEFVDMSRKPGIAYNYFDQNCEEIYTHDEIHISTSKGGRSIKPPKYFDRQFERLYPEMAERLKAERKLIAECSNEAILSRTGLDYLSYLKVKESEVKLKTKLLLRKEF